MSDFTWIKTSLCLRLLLHVTAVTGNVSYITVRDGDRATLPCDDTITDQDGCDGTTWLLSVMGNSTEVELVNLGQIADNAKNKSDRLSVAADCSLVIKKVTAEDVGRYTCRQFNKSGRQQSQDAPIHLSLISMIGHKTSKAVTLFCSVLSYGDCRHTVKWLHQNNDVDKHEHTTTSESGCSATMSFSTSYYDEKPKYLASLRCEVTDKNNKDMQLCSFTPWSSCKKTGEDPTQTIPAELTTTASPTTQGARTDCSSLDYIMLAMRVAELLLITGITVLLVRGQGKKRPPDAIILSNSDRSPPVKYSGPAAGQTCDDADGGAVNYENLGEPFVSVRRH